MTSLANRAAICGIGAAPFQKKSTRSNLAMAVEAIKYAIEDAGLPLDAVDGVISHVFDPIPEREIVNCFGWKNIRHFCRSPYGSSTSTVGMAAMAVALGQANYCVAFRSLSGRMGDGPLSESIAGEQSFYQPYGMRAPAHWFAVMAQRYLHDYHADPRAFGWIAVASRRHGATNPRAINFGMPITIDDHQSSRIVASPLRLLDCTPNTEGAVAILVTTPERARALRQRPVYVREYVQGTGHEIEHGTSYNRRDMIVPEETQAMAREMWSATGLSPKDISFLQVYDHFTSSVLMAIEGWGFCGLGEGPAFVEAATRITLGGALPLNTGGGHLGEGYLQLMGHIAESVRQLRGQAANQVPHAKLGLVTAGAGLPSSSMLLASESI